eukprot:scaffold923_cov256-Pinguiococcus_pyrenoidosus.AAC.61
MPISQRHYLALQRTAAHAIAVQCVQLPACALAMRLRPMAALRAFQSVDSETYHRVYNAGVGGGYPFPWSTAAKRSFPKCAAIAGPQPREKRAKPVDSASGDALLRHSVAQAVTWWFLARTGELQSADARAQSLQRWLNSLRLQKVRFAARRTTAARAQRLPNVRELAAAPDENRQRATVAQNYAVQDLALDAGKNAVSARNARAPLTRNARMRRAGSAAMAAIAKLNQIRPTVADDDSDDDDFVRTE